jgi:hypothetical protein
MLLLPDIYISAVSAQLPPMVITATRTPVLCTGSACRQAIEELTRLLLPENYFQQSRPETPEPVEATKEQVCAAIKAKQPLGCTSMPVIVGVNGGSPNGCGSGLISSLIARAYLSAISPSFTGSLDRPIRDVNFEPACNTHDECFSRQEGFGTCNTSFTNTLNGICAASAQPQPCQQIANAYSQAVGTNFANDNYTADGRALACFKFQNDLKNNGCS